jgi:hypothetical protein
VFFAFQSIAAAVIRRRFLLRAFSRKESLYMSRPSLPLLLVAFLDGSGDDVCALRVPSATSTRRLGGHQSVTACTILAPGGRVPS